MTKEEFTEIAWSKFQKWSDSQKGQISGYEYEKSFDKMFVEMSKDILEKEVNDKEVPLRKKKDKNPFWKYKNIRRSCPSDTDG